MYIYISVCAIMKKMCPPGYHRNGHALGHMSTCFVATYALGHMFS